MIYLDNAATTYPKAEEVYKALDRANREYAFNAGRGSYASAKKTFEMIKETKEKLAKLVNASADSVSFESSATEALNIIIYGLDLSEGDTVYVSPFEHNAVIRPLYYLQKEKNIHIEILPFDKKTWEVDKQKMDDMFALHHPSAVFLSHVSNVTGYILPYEDIFSASKKYNAVNVLDCSQSLGILNPETNNVDLIVFAGHKSLYASFGVAGFINVGNINLKVVKSGGTGSDSLNHEMPSTGSERYEAGSHNSVAIAGLNASLDWLEKTNVYEHEKELTRYLIQELQKLDSVKLFLPENLEKVIGIVSFDVIGYQADDVGTILSEDFEICVRTGYHCSPFIHQFIGSEEYLGTVRIGLGYFNDQNELSFLINSLQSL